MGKEPIVHTTERRRSVSKPSDEVAGDPSEESSHPTSHLPEITLATDRLPSKGIPYPDDAEISYRTFSYGEIKKISESKLNVKDRFNMVLKGIKTSFPKEELTLNDFFYIGMLRKISSISSTKLVAEYTCGKCRGKGKHIFQLTDIEFQDIEAPKLPVKASLSFGEVKMTPLTIGDFYSMLEMKRGDDDVAATALQVRNMEYKKAYKALYNMSIEDARIVNEIDKVLDHGVLPFKFECGIKNELDERCKSKITIRVDKEDTLIMPFREHEESPRDRISFGD